MAWKRLDDDQVGDNVSWGAIQTERSVANLAGIVVDRQPAATWSWNELTHTNTNVAPNFITRYVRLGGKNPRGMLWQWSPHAFTTQVTVEMLYQVPTIPGVNVKWYLTTSTDAKLYPLNGTQGNDFGTPNAGPVAPAVFTWVFDLADIQQGDVRPYVFYLFLEVTSETSNDAGDVEVYQINVPPTERDFRANNQTGVRYGYRYLDTSETTFSQNIEKFEITNIGPMDTTAKPLGFSTNWAFQGRPYDIILREQSDDENGTVIWHPAMPDFAYFGTVDALEITRVGELQLESLTISETEGTIEGPAGAPGALVRSISGGRAAKGPEHMQVYMAQDQVAYGRVPVFAWGPQVSAQSSIFVPAGAVGVDSVTTGACPIVHLNEDFYTLSEYRIGDDSTFSGDLPNSQRRAIEYFPMMLLLTRTEGSPESFDVVIRWSFVRADGTVATFFEAIVAMKPYWSQQTSSGWWGLGLTGVINQEMRTAFSSNALWNTADVLKIIRHLHREPQPLFGADETTDNTYLRVEVRSFEPGESGHILVDLGAIVRALPAWSDDGRTIAAVTRDT